MYILNFVKKCCRINPSTKVKIPNDLKFAQKSKEISKSNFQTNKDC